MNFFYDLPDEIQEKIYFEAHKLNSKDLFKQIKKIDFWKQRVTPCPCRQDPPDIYIDLEMTKLLYTLGATQEELREYYCARDWLCACWGIDGSRPDFENKYIKVWRDINVYVDPSDFPEYFRPKN